jgi:hypothetical protein
VLTQPPPDKEVMHTAGKRGQNRPHSSPDYHLEEARLGRFKTIHNLSKKEKEK